MRDDRFLRAMESLRKIAADSGLSEGAVTSFLHRMRKKLKTMLKKEGIL